MLPEGFDMEGLMAQAQAMQAQMMAAQEELAAMRVPGSAAGGLVTVEVTGSGELVGVKVSPEAWDPDDTDALGDMIVAAYRDASARAEQVAAARMPAVPDMGI